MGLRLSVPEFGGPLASYETNSDFSTLRADASWFVDFSSFGPKIAIDFAAIVNVGNYSVASSRIVLLAASVDGGIVGPVLAEIDPPLAGTGGANVGILESVVVANPGTAYHYLVLASQGGSG